MIAAVPDGGAYQAASGTPSSATSVTSSNPEGGAPTPVPAGMTTKTPNNTGSAI